VPTFALVKGATETEPGKYLVKAAGYYAAVGA